MGYLPIKWIVSEQASENVNIIFLIIVMITNKIFGWKHAMLPTIFGLSVNKRVHYSVLNL